MARDWTDTASIRAAIFERMANYGDNIAVVPYCEYQQREDGNELKWIVDLHVKVRGVTEFEVTGEGSTLAKALRGAYLALNNEPMVLARAARSNEAFGVTV